ncbi:MAG TPA: hypothetical protein PKE16_11025 [Hyphomicrobium sp.]|nr:hypothetical protein [Hyphomicrobium sp.]
MSSSRTSTLPANPQAPTVIDALKRSAKPLGLVATLIGTLTFLSLSLIAPRYQSQVELAVVPQGGSATTPAAAGVTPEAMSRYVRALHSPFVLRRVADELALAKLHEFNAALGPVDLLDAALRQIGINRPGMGSDETARVVAALQNSLDVSLIPNGHAITLRVTSIDAERAAKIANAIASTYQAMLAQEQKVEQLGLATETDGAQGKAAVQVPLEVRIVSKAVPNHVVTFPKKLELSLMAAAAALLFGMALVVLAAALRSTPLRKTAKRSDMAVLRPELSLVATSRSNETAEAATGSEATVELKITKPQVTLAVIDAAVPSPVSEIVRAADVFNDIDALVARLKAYRPSGGGHRTLITSDMDAAVPFEQALELAKALAGCGAQTILIDWSPSGNGLATTAGLDTRAGWNDLLRGNASFDGIIQRLPGTRAQAIASGAELPNGNAKFDADFLNLALDALDEVYDHIVVTARHGEARSLFECIEGRFDAGITVMPNGNSTLADAGDASMFLGFEVADIDVMRYRQSEPAVSSMAQRIARATRSREPIAQSA